MGPRAAKSMKNFAPRRNAPRRVAAACCACNRMPYRRHGAATSASEIRDAPPARRTSASAVRAARRTDMPDARKAVRPTLIEAWNDHMAQEFVHRDVYATLATMTDAPHVITVPLAIGGRGRRAVRDFYARHFIGLTPADMRV